MEEKTVDGLLSEAMECISKARDLLRQTQLLCQEATINVPVDLRNFNDLSSSDKDGPPDWCAEIIEANPDWCELLDLTKTMHEHLDLIGGPCDHRSSESAIGSSDKQIDVQTADNKSSKQPAEEDVLDSDSSTSHIFVEADEIVAPHSSQQTSSNSTLEYIRARLQRAPVRDSSTAKSRLGHQPSLPRLDLKGIGQCSWLSGGKTQGETYTTVS